MKKIFTYIASIWIIIGLIGSFCVCNWQRFGWGGLSADMPYIPKNDPLPKCDSTNVWDCVSIKEDVTNSSNDTIIIRLLWVFWLDTDRSHDLKFIDYARAIINMALGLVAFIALIMSLYTFYMMFFSDNEAWTKKAKWNLIGIFIALAVLWLAWLIVSFIFWRYQSNWKEKENDLFPESGITALNYINTLDNQIYLTI